jgi:1,4-dihydroxy-2-naphthoate octaprenyltransferase
MDLAGKVGASMRPSTLLHLRFPFSFFLLPVYLAGLWVAGPLDLGRSLVVFVVLHLLVYPASNGFNSFFDRDEGPIGGLAAPPPVSPALLPTALALDALGLALAFLAGPLFALAVFIYGGFSKLYSWPPVRLKRMPVTGWLATGLGQGGLTLLAVVIGCSRRGVAALDGSVFLAAAAVSVLLLGIYPLTQVYQHEEDGRRGDRTISILVGIRGTFVLAGSCLLLAVAGLALLVHARDGLPWSLILLGSQAPALVLFASWAAACFRDPAAADWRRAMRMNLAASTAMNLFLCLILLAGRGP